MSFFYGLGVLYIDGKLHNKYSDYNSFMTAPYLLNSSVNFKLLAFFDKAAHFDEQIINNTQFIAQKYGIQI